MATITIFEPAEYAPLVSYDRISKTFHCDCWLCGYGVERKTHKGAVNAGIKCGIRVQCVDGEQTGYGNRCSDCRER